MTTNRTTSRSGAEGRLRVEGEIGSLIDPAAGMEGLATGRENIVLRGSGLPPLREGATAFLLRAGEKAGPGRADAAGRSTASRVPFPTALASAICLAGRLLHKRRKA